MFRRTTVRTREVRRVLEVALAAVLCVAGSAFGATLPDGRAYELVSPPVKNGGDIMGDSARTRVAADGSVASFSSLVGFGGVQGMSVGIDYISQRTGAPNTNGWTAHSITPEQPAMTIEGTLLGRDPLFDGELSQDFSRGVFRSWLPIEGVAAGNAANMANLYLRNDLLSPGPGSYRLLTEPQSPVVARARPFLAGATPDFSHVIFESGLALTDDAPAGGVKLYEAVSTGTRLAGRIPSSGASCDDVNGPACDGTSSRAGLGASSRYTYRMISEDGSRIFFQVPATGNVYMRSDGATTVQLNASEKTSPESPQGASLWTAATDGSRAFFITSEGLVEGDDDGSTDVYMYDATTGPRRHLSRLSGDAETLDGHSALGIVGASANGRYVYFVSAGQLVVREPLLFEQRGLYLWHDGAIRYIGSFANGADTDLNSPQTSWGTAVGTSTARVTLDGRHLLFMSRSDAGFRGRGGFAGYDHGAACSGTPCRELYVYKADSGGIRCASCNPSGAAAIGDASIHTRVGAGAANTSWHLSHALSEDGHKIYFNTSEELVPEDANGKSDAYQYDTISGVVHLISSGLAPSDSYFLDASASGDDVFFLTRERLVGWDIDDNYDLYDARVHGGFPEPIAPAPRCSGDVCQGQPSAPPRPTAVGTAALKGSGNAPPQVRPKRKHCRRGSVRRTVRGKARCVRRREHRNSKRARSQRRGK